MGHNPQTSVLACWREYGPRARCACHDARAGWWGHWVEQSAASSPQCSLVAFETTKARRGSVDAAATGPLR